MEIEKSLQDDVLCLALRGDFDTTEVGYFDALISEAIDAGQVRIILDLQELRFVNSTALGALLRAGKRLGQYGGSLVVARPTPAVDRTFRLLQLDRRIPIFDAPTGGAEHLRSIDPGEVGGEGHEVEFHLPEAEGTFGPRPRRGTLVDIEEEGLTLAFENLDRLPVEEVFRPGSPVHLRFRLPLYHPSHVFGPKGEIEGYEQLGRETIHLRVRFTELADRERSAIRRYAKDLEFLRDEE